MQTLEWGPGAETRGYPYGNVLTLVNTTAIAYWQKTSRSLRICWYAIAVVFTNIRTLRVESLEYTREGREGDGEGGGALLKLCAVAWRKPVAVISRIIHYGTRSRHEEPEHLCPNLVWTLRYAGNLPYKILIPVFRSYMSGTCTISSTSTSTVQVAKNPCVSQIHHSYFLILVAWNKY